MRHDARALLCARPQLDGSLTTRGYQFAVLRNATCGRHVTHSVPPSVGVWPAVRLLGASGAVPDASGCPSEPFVLTQTTAARAARSARATTPGKVRSDMCISSVRVRGARGRRQRGSLTLRRRFSREKAILLLWRRRAGAHAAQGEPLRQRRPNDYRALTRRGCHTCEALRHALRKQFTPLRQRTWCKSKSQANCASMA